MKTTFGGNSGYVGYSESKRSVRAKASGRFPKTEFKKHYGIPEKMFKTLEKRGIISISEWHHTSKFGNRTNFYSINDEVLFFYIIGDVATARELYCETLDYSAKVVYNKRKAIKCEVEVRKTDEDIVSDLLSTGIPYSKTKRNNYRFYLRSNENLQNPIVRKYFL